MVAIYKDRNNKDGSGKECIPCEVLGKSNELLRIAVEAGYDACKVVGCSDPKIRGRVIGGIYQRLVEKEIKGKLEEKEIEEKLEEKEIEGERRDDA